MISLKKRVLFGSAWIFTGKIVTVLSGLATSAFLARLLTPNELGAYFLTVSIVTLAALIGQLGMMRAVVRLIAESIGIGSPGRAKAVIRHVFFIGALSALAVGLLYHSILGQWLARKVFHSTHIAEVIGTTAIWLVVSIFQNLLAETFRGFSDIRMATVFGGLVRSLVSAILFAILWYTQGHSNFKQIMVLSVIAGGASIILAGLCLNHKVKQLEGEGHIDARKILATALPMLIIALSTYATINSDIWILGAFRSQEEVAVYGAVKRLILVFVMPLTMINSVVQPLIAEYNVQGKIKELESLLRSAATLAGLPLFLVLIVIILFGAPILGQIYGNFYRQGSLVLVILAVGMFINVWTGSCGSVLMMTGHQKMMMIISMMFGLINIGGSLWIVNFLGSSGIALVAALTLGAQNILFLVYTKMRLGVWTHMQPAIPNLKYFRRKFYKS